jgi:catechol 2,3-dioxygenase-like lactoylglutathione lyase family enzyme
VNAQVESIEQEPERRPGTCGVPHVKLPVRDPAISRDWYGRVLGFEQELRFVEEGALMGVALHHPRSGVRVAVRRASGRRHWRTLIP